MEAFPETVPWTLHWKKLPEAKVTDMGQELNRQIFTIKKKGTEYNAFGNISVFKQTAEGSTVYILGHKTQVNMMTRLNPYEYVQQYFSTKGQVLGQPDVILNYYCTAQKNLNTEGVLISNLEYR